MLFLFQGTQTDCDLYFQIILLPYFITLTFQNSQPSYVFWVHKRFHGYRFLSLIRAIWDHDLRSVYNRVVSEYTGDIYPVLLIITCIILNLKFLFVNIVRSVNSSLEF